MYTFSGLTRRSPECSRDSEVGDIIFKVFIRKRLSGKVIDEWGLED